MFFLETLGEFHNKVHIVGFHSFLKRITDIPAFIASGIGTSVGVADRETMPVGGIHQFCFAIGAGSAITVEAENQRGSFLQSRGSVEVIFPGHALMLEGAVGAPALNGSLAVGWKRCHRKDDEDGEGC